MLVVTLLSGCKNDVGFINARWITEASLTSVTTSDQKQADHSGHSETLMLKESNLIKTLAEAMNKSNTLLGELDWAPERKLTFGTADKANIEQTESLEHKLKLDKVDDHSFKRSYYDNAAGKQMEGIFQWDGSVFQKLDK
ncbi:hypothetical protein [Paenibacillus etheri]|uniref:Uncharacterized protein n=1 Tax=Paenibacillus etheri TaxID=1306852 RepID=A0A0W1B2Q8_9BACL|nr:hypothetical protein [Paenibacillus etheri]KTD87869.1 hypothetical protein UQ64_07065 [Paenibacillus etheri]